MKKTENMIPADAGSLAREAAEFFAVHRTPEIPAELDRAVLTAARRYGIRRKLIRIGAFRFAPLAAAAAVAVAIGVNFFAPDKPAGRPAVNEALAGLSDWSRLDQESYVLSQEIMSNQFAMSEW